MAPLKARLGARDSARLCSDKVRLVLTELRERNTDRALGLGQAGDRLTFIRDSSPRSPRNAAQLGT